MTTPTTPKESPMTLIALYDRRDWRKYATAEAGEES